MDHSPGDELMVRERSLRFLEDEQLKYQAVELPGGVTTPGHDRSYLKRPLFGDDFKGRSFLDIGSYLGYFCIEALRRGASHATGIETDPRNVRQARAIAELWGLEPEYICGDFEGWKDADRRFDTVACLNVLHHLFDPIHALKRMMALARDRLILEVAVPTWRDVGRDFINPLRLANIGAPALFLGVPKKRGDAAGRTFLFTPKALQVLFNVHTTAFEPIAISRSPFKGRILVEAQKRRIGELVVVAGPTAVGKSTLSSRLLEDAGLRGRLGLGPGPWRLVDAADVGELPPGPHERLILHYDILRPSRTGMRSHDRDPVLHLMGLADRLTILTLTAPAERLQAQLQQGEIARQGRNARQRRRDLDLLASYANPNFLRDWYGAWVGFCSQYDGARHFLMRNNGEFVPEPVQRWEEALQSCLSPAPRRS